jgi:hypothetical protein
MKLSLTSGTIGASLMLGCSLLIAPMAYGAPQTCSVEKLQGRYVFTGQGTNYHYGAFDFRANRPRCVMRSFNAKL